MPERDIKKDLRWGIQGGIVLTAVVFVPALLAVVQRPWTEFERNFPTYAKVVVLYFAFGAGGGAAVGLCRPLLTRRVGAALVGGAIGASGFLALMYVPHAGRPAPEPMVGLVAVLLGFLTGFFLGWWAWGVSMR